MLKLKKRNYTNLLFLFLLLFSTVINVPNAEAASEPDIKARSAILIDGNSGKILYQLNPDDTLPPASMSKMMTEYLVLEAIDKGEISWDQKFKVSEFVEQLSRHSNLSNIELRLDTEYTVRELYESMAIYSANASTIALAELIAGSETEFVKMMNAKAEEMNLENFHFVNSTGLNNSDLLGKHPEGTGADEENMLSAKATAKLAYRLINDYPEVLETASIPLKTFREGTIDSVDMLNWNWMLPGMTGYLEQFTYEGVDGIKTGSTELAGSAFTGTAERDGMRLISVVMRTESRSARFEETKKLFDYGFENFEKVELFPANYQIDGESVLPVENGKEKEVEISSKEPISATIKNGEQELYTPKLELDEQKLNQDGTLTAPVNKGDQVGQMIVEYSGENDYGYIFDEGKQEETAPLVTNEAVEKANWFVLMLRGVGGFFSDIWVSVATTVKGMF
jgi:D-alanyl-D-alanine carboxypeptidase (penicillin-binding protein 5/6)